MAKDQQPELIIQSFETAGVNNSDLEYTHKRLSKTKSWKRQRVITILPTAKMIAAKVALSHRNLVFPPNNQNVWMLAIGAEVGQAYSSAIEQILAHPELSEWEYVLTIESDNCPPSNGLIKLIERMEENPRFSAISGLYFTKGHGEGGLRRGGGVAQIWGDPKDPVLNFRPQLPDPNGGLVECNGTGCGFVLWRLKMFKSPKLRKPWFVTQTKDGVATQDLYFWSDAKKHGFRCAVDCSVKVGHYSVEEDFMY